MTPALNEEMTQNHKQWLTEKKKKKSDKFF